MKRLLILTCLVSAVISTSCTAPKGQPETGNVVIGISCAMTDNNSRISRNYTESVIKAGGVPFLLPITKDTTALLRMLDEIDAIIMSGGEDINPEYYGEKPPPELGSVDTLRDAYDIFLVRKAAERKIPVLGICRGEQLINVAFGGSLYQDIPSQCKTEIGHNQKESSRIPTHKIDIVEGTWIAGIVGSDEYMVNSFHHQAAKQIAPGFIVSAWSPTDSIPEAIECIDGRAIWGVQFHPEGLTAGGDTTALKFFQFIVEKGREYKNSRTAAK